MFKIGIDAGHGGKDPGAVGNNKREKDIALSYAKALDKELKNRGYSTVLTRDRDFYLSLKRRSTIFNNHKVDIAISLHLNSYSSPSANGIETFYWYNSTKGKRLASLVQNKIKKYWKSDRGVKTKNLHMTREPKAPAILIELGFISNKEDLQSTLKNQEAIVNSIVDAIDEYFGIVRKAPQSKPKPHWAEKHYNSLNKKGVKIHEKRYDDNITRGEVFALLDRAK